MLPKYNQLTPVNRQLAIIDTKSLDPLALRPRLSTGLPNIQHEKLCRLSCYNIAAPSVKSSKVHNINYVKIYGSKLIEANLKILKYCQ